MNGRPGAIIVDYNEAIRLKPDYAIALNNLAVVIRFLGVDENEVVARRVAFVEEHLQALDGR